MTAPAHPTQYAILAALLVAWCALHSAMISLRVTGFLERRLGKRYRYYRLFFNAVALVTLLPVLGYAASLRTEPLFDWHGYRRIGQALLAGTAVALFVLGARHYDTGRFLGARQVRGGKPETLLTHTGKLDTTGVLGVTRHPWYLGGILLIWARPLDLSAIVTNVVFTAYLVSGTYLEERKLVREFGRDYREYRERVSILLPFKRLRALFRRP